MYSQIRRPLLPPPSLASDAAKRPQSVAKLKTPAGKDTVSSPRQAVDETPVFRPWPCARKHAAAALCTATQLNEAEEADLAVKIDKANAAGAEVLKKAMAAHAKAPPGTPAPTYPQPSVIPLPSLPQVSAAAGATSKR